VKKDDKKDAFSDLMNYGVKKNTKPVNNVSEVNTNNNDNFSFNPFN